MRPSGASEPRPPAASSVGGPDGPGAGDLETAEEMAVALRSGAVSSTELVGRALRRAGMWQPVTNAFSQLWEDEALEEARRIDGLPRDDRPPLAGVPLAVKDLFDVAGHETTGCCEAYRGNVAGGDAPVIEAIRRAGLVVIGKTNQHELAAGGTNTVSSCGPTRNPWDAERMTGGSSGGSAAAIASGVVPWALGSDTGGSIRIPSSLCGTFGLKPTTGRLPTAGLMPLAPTMDCPGPMGSTATAVGLLLDALGGRDPGTTGARGAPRRVYRVGLPGGFFATYVRPEVLQGVDHAAGLLATAGVAFEMVDGSGIDDARDVWRRCCFAEFAAAHPSLADRRDRVHPSVLEWMDRGAALSAEERGAAARRRSEIASWFRERLEGRDALLVPTSPYWAPRHEQREIDLGIHGVVSVDHVGPGWHTSSVNLAGLPALSIPAGWLPEGLPFGVSLIGHDDGEATLLELAERWTTAAGYRPRHPAPGS